MFPRGFPGAPDPDVSDEAVDKAADAVYKQVHRLLNKIGSRGSFEFKPQNEYEEKGAVLNDSVQELKKKVKDPEKKITELKLQKPLNEEERKLEQNLVTLQQNLDAKLDTFNVEMKGHFERWKQGEKVNTAEWKQTIDNSNQAVNAEFQTTIDLFKGTITAEEAKQQTYTDELNQLMAEQKNHQQSLDTLEAEQKHYEGLVLNLRDAYAEAGPQQQVAIQQQIDLNQKDLTKTVNEIATVKRLQEDTHTKEGELRGSQQLTAALKDKINQLDQERKNIAKEVEAFEKKHLRDELNRLKQSIENQNLIAYSKKKSEELGISDKWRRVGELKGDSDDELGFVNPYTRALRDGVYTNPDSEVTISIKNGIVRSHGAKIYSGNEVVGEKVPFEVRKSAELDALIKGGMEEVEWEIDNPQHGKEKVFVANMDKAIAIAESKGLKVRLGDNAMIALAEYHPKDFARIEARIKQINAGHKTHEEQLVGTRRNFALDEQIRKLGSAGSPLDLKLSEDKNYQDAKQAAETKGAGPGEQKRLEHEENRVKHQYQMSLEADLRLNEYKTDPERLTVINQQVGRDMVHYNDLKEAKQLFDRNLLALQHDMKVNPNQRLFDAQYQRLESLGQKIDKRLHELQLRGEVWQALETRISGQPAPGDARSSIQQMTAMQKMKVDLDTARNNLGNLPAQRSALQQEEKANAAEAKQNAARGIR